MFDLLVRNGLVVDGTGGPARACDIGITDGSIVAVGVDLEGPATRTIDATGLVVAPGFVDVHTHYDAQVFWDAGLTPSPFHGVTTVVSGNCGLTLAPITDEHQDFMVRLLARVEQIPVAALMAGVDIRWNTFGEFLDTVDALPLAINVGFMTGHSALRRNVMGAAASSDAATAEQIEGMQALLRESLEAGSFGLSSATALNHRDGDGRPTPPNFAQPEEMLALADVVGEFPGTCLEYIPGSFMTGFSDVDAETMADMSAHANRHLNWNTVMINPGQLDMWHAQLAVSDLARERGGWVVPQAIPHNFRTRTDFLDAELGFRNLPGWDALFVLDEDARRTALADPATRRQLRLDLDTADNPFTRLYRDSLGELVVNDVEDTGRFGHLRGRRLEDLAAERGDDDPLDTLFDLAVETELGIGFCRYAFRDDDEDLQRARREMLSDPRVLLGASDGGAHIDGTMNTEYPTASFADLVRRRGWFTVEQMVHRLADVPARLYGLYDRGRIEPGFRADLVVFDPATIGPGPAELVRDLPGGARRLLAGATGIERVLVGGVEIVVDGVLTGAHPGRLLRAGIDSVTVPARSPVTAGD